MCSYGMVKEDKSYIKAYQNREDYRYIYLHESSYGLCRKKIGLKAFGSKNKKEKEPWWKRRIKKR